MLFSTAQIPFDSYLEVMQALLKEDVFLGVEPREPARDLSMRSSEPTFDAVRGLLTASVLSLAMWAALLFLCRWIWL